MFSPVSWIPTIERSPTLAYQISPNAQGVPTITWLGENEHPKGLLPAVSFSSIQRRIILKFLREGKKPLGPTLLARHTDQSYDAAAKMLQRMRKSNEVVCVGHGLYTTPNHPCLATFNVLLGDDDDDDDTPAFTPISPAQIVARQQPPVQTVHPVSLPEHDQPPVQSVQTVPLLEHDQPPVQSVQTRKREPFFSKLSRLVKGDQPPVHTVQIVHDTSEETARAREAYLHLAYGPDGVHRHPPTDDPGTFYMPGTSPNELEPYEPIWEQATTPPPPQPHLSKEQRESENRSPFLRINPPSILYPSEGPYS